MAVLIRYQIIVLVIIFLIFHLTIPKTVFFKRIWILKIVSTTLTHFIWLLETRRLPLTKVILVTDMPLMLLFFAIEILLWFEKRHVFFHVKVVTVSWYWLVLVKRRILLLERALLLNLLLTETVIVYHHLRIQQVIATMLAPLKETIGSTPCIPKHFISLLVFDIDAYILKR